MLNNLRAPAQRTYRANRLRPEVESLESRLVPYSTSGNIWPRPELITISFVPDGATVASNGSSIPSNLYAEMNAQFGGPESGQTYAPWQREILRAAQTWSQMTNINFKVVSDNGTAIGGGANQQGDPNFGDIRVGGFDFGNTTLAQAYMPPPANNTSFAGDIQFNTAETWSGTSGYDLYTVALHEFGHALGIYHSGVITSAMYDSWQGIKTALDGDDTAAIRSVYSGNSARAVDAYDNTANETFASADDLTSVVTNTPKAGVVNGLDLTTSADVDFFKFTTPTGTNSSIKVKVQSSGLSLLAPKVTVYASDMTTVKGSANALGDRDGATLTVTVTGVTAGQVYYVKIQGAEGTTGTWSGFNTGKYALVLNCGTGADPNPTLPNTTVANGATPTSGGGQAAKVTDQLRVNSFTTNNQYLRYSANRPVAMDGNGNYVVVWTSYGQDGSSSPSDGVYAQRYNKNGQPLGGEFRVNTYTTSYQYGPSVGMNATGAFVVAWRSGGQDGSGNGVYAQRYNASGVAQGPEFRVNTSTANAQEHPVVAVDNSGNFIIAWDSWHPGSHADTYFQRYDAAGNPLGGETLVNTYTSDEQTYPSIGIDNNGNFVIAWLSEFQDGTGTGVYAQRYYANGTRNGSEFRVNTTTAGVQEYPKVAMQSGGAFAIAWQGAGAGDADGVFLQRYNASGVAQGGETLINSITADLQADVSLQTDNNGALLAVWSSSVSGSSTKHIVGQQFNSSGVKVGTEFRVTTTSMTNDAAAAVAMNNNGNAVVVWSGTGSGDGDGVYSQVYNVKNGSGLSKMEAHGFHADGDCDGHDHDQEGHGDGCACGDCATAATRSTLDRNTGYAVLPSATADADLDGLRRLLANGSRQPSRNEGEQATSPPTQAAPATSPLTQAAPATSPLTQAARQPSARRAQRDLVADAGSHDFSNRPI